MRTNNILLILLMLAVTMIGCGRNISEHEHDDEHEHEVELHLTTYTLDYEVYVVATPFVVGQTGQVLAHITSVDDFKPLNQGGVTATLTSGNVSVMQTLEGPTQTGIYDFRIQPAGVGIGELSFDIETNAGVLVVRMQPIEVFGDSPEAIMAASQATSHLSEVGANSASFSKEQSWKIDFSTEVVEERSVGQIIRSTGQIRNTPEDVRVVSSAMGGIVQFADGNLFPGKEVTARQSLFRIDASGMADNNLSVRFAEAESEYTRAKSEYERKEILAAERIVNESELNQALAEYKIAEANYNNLKDNFSTGSQSVVSPISAYVKELLVKNGQYVDAGQPVITLSQNKNLIIQSDLQPKYFELLDDITAVNFRMVNGERTYSLDEFGGKIMSYSRSTNIFNPLITLTMQLGNGADLLPGSFVEMFLITEGDLPVITVLNESIVEEMGNYFVYVQLTPELFDKRLIERGATDGVRTEIQEGLLAGERVVGKGAVLLKLSQSAGSVDVHAGHVH